ncbi:MAG: hypothetical protein JJT77_02235 [Crocinitomicaceae bacterium]|nr:hypothetical protein [Crocinitomicaceae bacterium]
MRLILSYCCLLWTSILLGQQTTHDILLPIGAVSQQLRDESYSPLKYDGWNFGFGAGYVHNTERKRNEFHVLYSQGSTSNQFNAKADFIKGSILTYTFYQNPEQKRPIDFGWSNNNTVDIHFFEASGNFSPRVYFYTTFGPALRYAYTIPSRTRWTVTSQANWQLLGFGIPSSYISAIPDPFLYEENVARAFFKATTIYNPFNEFRAGSLTQITYQLRNENQIALGYRFDFSSTMAAHRLVNAAGFYHLQLNFRL